jgi:ketosteroid isomerase-like protein
MHELDERMLAALNAHDLDAFVACFHEDYRSEHPAHPDRAFTGREQVRENWAAMFAGIPDFRAELAACAGDDTTRWQEWVIQGTRRDGAPLDLRGVIICELRDGRIAAARLYLEEVASTSETIAETVQRRTGS